jgi:predicted SAM-dependent methyltransferase
MNCNICGNDTFTTGPGNRKSKSGGLPQCTKCHSLERHRALRIFYNKITQINDFKNHHILQISADKVLDADYFHDIEISVYGKSNSIDIQQIDRLNDSYNIVVCNHVIEHVKDDITAIRELIRITSRDGFTQLAVPDPLNRNKTTDWGYSDEAKHGHYRVYGKDFIDKLIASVSNMFEEIYFSEIYLNDPVTTDEHVMYLVSRNSKLSAELFQIFKKITDRKICYT